MTEPRTDTSVSSLTPRDGLWATLCFLLVFAVYLFTLAPTVTGEDAGELVAASYLNGVAHPPGYPAWCLLTKPFFLIPYGDIACRANLASAFWGACTVAGLFLLARLWGCGRPGAWLSAVGFGVSLCFWSQANIAEVYTLNTAFLVLILILADRLRRHIDDGSIHQKKTLCALGGLIFGLSLANHYMLMLLVSPGILWLLLPSRRFVKKRKAWIAGAVACLALAGISYSLAGPVMGRYTAAGFAAIGVFVMAGCLWSVVRAHATILLLAGGGVLIGLSAYAYLPLAASASPYVNWGDPSTWKAFTNHVLRTSYRSLEFAYTPTWADKLSFLKQFGQELAAQFTPWLTPLMLAGVVTLFRKDKRRFVASLLVFCCNTFLLILILRFAYEHENRQRMEVYYLPAYMMAALWIGTGATWILGRIGRRSSGSVSSLLAPAFGAVVLLLPAVPLIRHWQDNDRSRYTIARDYSEAILDAVDENAILFPSADFTTFPLLYLIGVENRRPDVLLADKYGTLSQEAHVLFRSLRPEVQRATKADILVTLIRQSGRPVYFTDRSAYIPVPGFSLRPEGLVYRVIPRSELQTDAPAARMPDIFSLQAASVSADSMERALAVSVYRMHAEASLSRGQNKTGALLLRKAALLQPGDHRSLNNLGSVAAEYGLREEACRLFEQAIEAFPRYVTPRVNLARIALETGDIEKARQIIEEGLAVAPGDARLTDIKDRIDRKRTRNNRVEAFREALQKSPNDPVLHNNLGTAYAEVGQLHDAAKHWLEAIRLDPSYALPHKNLAAYYRNERNDPLTADEYQARFEELSKGHGTK